MQKRTYIYWWCQLIGWLVYGATMLFFAFVFNQKMTDLFYTRISISILFGFSFTHLLREVILALKMVPPIEKKLWIKLPFLIIATCILYSLTNSAVVEWLQLYIREIKISVQKRFLYNLFNDSPIILVWVSIYYVWHYIEAGRKSEIDKVRLESLVKELELKTIKSHINPHFIFNALNSIRALVDENPTRARQAITELSNILRSSMQAEKSETAAFEKELGIVKSYLALEHIRFEDRLQVEYDIDDDTLNQPVPPMMLQTLVENAIKHGISKLKQGGLIRIISDFKDNHHELIVQNTGHLNGVENADGFGLSSTQNRLKLLYAEKAEFSIKNIPEDMVEAKVILPVAGL